jgi:hypothetical protein
MKSKYFVSFVLILFGTRATAQIEKEKLHALMVIEVARNSDFVISGDAYVVTVLGNTPVFRQLQAQAQNLRIKGLPIHVLQVDAIDDIGETQVIFVPASMSPSFQAVLQKTGSKPVVVMTEEEHLYKDGAGFSLVQSEHAQFQVNVNRKALTAHGIKISRSLASVIRESI